MQNHLASSTSSAKCFFLSCRWRKNIYMYIYVLYTFRGGFGHQNPLTFMSIQRVYTIICVYAIFVYLLVWQMQKNKIKTQIASIHRRTLCDFHMVKQHRRVYQMSWLLFACFLFATGLCAVCRMRGGSLRFTVALITSDCVFRGILSVCVCCVVLTKVVSKRENLMPPHYETGV